MDTIQYRTITLDTRAADNKARTVPAVVSTATPVDRGGWSEVLLHTKQAIDLSRAPLPLLTGHDARSVNVGLVEGLHLDGSKLRGTVRLGHSKQADDLWPDIKAGIVRGLSVGYSVSEWQPGDDDDTEIATRWQPHEVSLVGVAADPAAGLNRNQHTGKTTMDKETEDSNVIPHQRWLKQEKARRTEIRSLFELHRGVDDLLNECLDDPAITSDRASKLLLDELGRMNADPLGGGDFRQSSSSGSLSQRDMQDVGRRAFGDYTAGDTLTEFTAAATDAILMRGGVKLEKPHVAAADCSRMRMSDVAETILRQFGDRTSGMSRDQLIRKALSTRGISHSSSDFPNLLENVASKALLQGFNEVPAIYRKIAKIGDLPDFKEGSRTALSDFSDLEIVYENGEYKYGTFSDLKETLTLATYGKLFSISRQALINEDLNSFVGIPRGLASAAARTLDDLVISVLTTNAALNQDSTALFHADHGNLVAPGSGAAPSVSTLDAGFQAMGLQQAPGGATLDISPSILLVPIALDATARVLTKAINDPAGTTLAEPNPFQGRLEVVSTARLDADDPLQWYLMANADRYDTLEIAFLDGQTSPFLESKDGWTSDGVEYKVRIDAAAAATDFRGLYQNDGN